MKKKNKIYLFTKNLKTKKSNKKLNYVKIELFFIKDQKDRISYKLKLLKNTRIYSIFYISLLKSADFNTFIQKTFHYQSKKKIRNKKHFKQKKSKVFCQIKKILYIEKHIKINQTLEKLLKISELLKSTSKETNEIKKSKLKFEKTICFEARLIKKLKKLSTKNSCCVNSLIF